MAWYGCLGILLKCCEGRVTVIDLVNESVVEGCVVSVDEKMNINLKNALLTKPNGEQDVFTNFFAHGRKIRYVHLPDDTDPSLILTKEIDRAVSARFPSGKGRRVNTRKQTESRNLRKKVKEAVENGSSALRSTTTKAVG